MDIPSEIIGPMITAFIVLYLLRRHFKSAIKDNNQLEEYDEEEYDEEQFLKKVSETKGKLSDESKNSK